MVFKAVLVTTGRFTKAAYEYAAQHREVELVGPTRLATMLAEAWPDKRADLVVSVMCPKCREVLDLPLPRKGTTKGRCSNGHGVVNDLAIPQLFDFPTYEVSQRKTTRFPRRGKRRHW